MGEPDQGRNGPPQRAILDGPRVIGRAAEAERDHARMIDYNLQTFGQLAREAWSALQLFEHATALSLAFSEREDVNSFAVPFIDWQRAAVRDALSILYRFNEEAKALRRNIKMCPSVTVDAAKLDAADAAFDASFPDFKALRDATQHGGGKYGTHKATQRNAIEGRITLIENIYDNRMEMSVEGVVKVITLDQALVAALEDVRDLYFAAF